MGHVERIKFLLENTNLKFTEIAAEVDVTSRTVQNINNGITHKEERDYPIRVTGRTLGELRTRLTEPTTAAVPRPNVLSPQLIDYISMLSLLEVPIDCLLEFREVYEKPLTEIFGRRLSDDELLSVITLRPTIPKQLNYLINAHDRPMVKFLNMNYWIKTGFIAKVEEEMVYSLFR